jgi:hypothetical protein
VLFRLAKDIDLQPVEPVEEKAVTVNAGTVVRLIPEYSNAPVAHLIWNGRKYSCNRSHFLRSASPIGPAPEE